MQITVISDTHGLHDRIKSLNKPFIKEVSGAGKMIISITLGKLVFNHSKKISC